MPESQTAYLRLDGIQKNFGSFAALNHIDLSIQRGEFVCFLGPSGCGKTTLLRIIAGLEVQTSGLIFQGDKDISMLPPSQRDYGIMFQSYALFPNLTVADNVAYGLVNRRQPRAETTARVTELLQLVGLPGSGAKFPAQMSGGQQQRVALARALATSPGLLLLDEPLSALDAIVRVHLRNQIRELQRQLGVTTVMVTHDQEEALSVADRIVVMNHGIVEQVGTPMEVYRQPATPFVASFVGKVNRLTGTAGTGNWFRCGELRFHCPQNTTAFTEGQPVVLHLRPEDRVVDGLCEGSPLNNTGIIRHIEFLGSNCLAEVEMHGMPNQPVQLQFSLNQMEEFGVHVGGSIRFALRTDRMRVFAAPKA